MNGFFEWLPNVALAGLALIIGLALWMIWRNISPAAPGISLGYYEVVGRYSGQKLIKRIRGTLVDATALFLNPQVETAFKQILREDVEELEKRTSQNLSEVKKALENLKLEEACRIIVTREKLFTKHVLIQYGHIDKPLNAYASYDPTAKFTLGFGFLTQGVITGEIHSFPQPWQIYKLGKVHVHLFKPDAPPNEPKHDPPEGLAKIALYAPATVELKEIIKAKDEQLKEKERELLKLGRERSITATKVDSLYMAVAGFTTEGKSGEALQPKKFDLLDFMTIAFPTFVGFYLAEYLGAPAIAGVFVGMFLGAFLVFRRG